jgi:N-acetylmuramoyl-L-alanine amidase/putative methionine-R-sulfoxide reductase with GAF domain
MAVQSLMATVPSKSVDDLGPQASKAPSAGWPAERSVPWSPPTRAHADNSSSSRPNSGGDALQALLAFSAMHQQIRKRRALALKHRGFEVVPQPEEFESPEQFVLDDVLQSVAERAIAITGADGLGIALAENNEIVLRASAGTIKPDLGARIQRDSAFSGACFRTAQIIRCDDTEEDDRVNVDACRKLGARSMVAVPLCGRRRVIGLLEAFSVEPFAFNDSDVSSLELLAELIVSALKPEDEDRFAESAKVAEAELIAPPIQVKTTPPYVVVAPKIVVAPEIAVSPAAALPPLADKPEATAIDIAPIPEGEAPASPELAPPQDLGSDLENSVRETTFLETVSEPQNKKPSGILLIAALLVVSVLAAGGLWWKFKTAEPANAPISSAENPTSTPMEAKTPAPAAVPSADNAKASSTAPSPAPVHPTDASGSVAAAETSKLSRITGIRHWSAADSSTVVLDLEEQVQYEAHRLSNPERIYFDLHETTLAPTLAGNSIEIADALLARVRVAQPTPGLTRVVLETKGNPTYSVSLEPNPYRLVVQVTKPGASPKSQINLFPGAVDAARQQLTIVIPPPTHEDLQLRARVPKMRIVVDAGHGGWDLGTVGRRGLLEKDVVFEIAQRLAKLLQSRLGADVILTRKDDTYIPLDERAAIANQAQADLFVSVHANYSDLPSARGVETYYTNFFSSPNTADTEKRDDNSGNRAAVTAVLSPADLHDRIEQSRRLAASVQRSLYGTLSLQNPGLRDRGVKEASYVVLTETAMPGILAEVSFVSSPTDEQKLRSDGYREQIAEALYKGIARYAATSRGVKLAAR